MRKGNEEGGRRDTEDEKVVILLALYHCGPRLGMDHICVNMIVDHSAMKISRIYGFLPP